MVTKENLQDFRDWFTGYTKSFIEEGGDGEKLYQLKFEHTLRVCTEIKQIGRGVNLENGNLRLAETIALFHDLGRFKQYKVYGTFADKESEDHAVLAVRILEEYKVLERLDKSAVIIIKKAIEYHNKKEIPAWEDPKTIFFTKLLRDADKLDIYRVVTEYYRTPADERDDSIGWGLPDNNEVNAQVLNEILNQKICGVDNLKSLNDFKLMQLSWVYDINFKRTFQVIRERRYLSMIYETLPVHIDVDNLRKVIRGFIDKQCLIDEFSLPDDYPDEH